MSIQSIAVNRFGIGGRPGDAPPGHPGQWLAAQFGRYQPRPAPIAAAADSASVATALAEYQREKEKLRQGSGEVSVAAPPPADPAHPAKADAAGGGTPQPLPDEQGRVRVSREVAERMARSAADGQARRTYADAVAARAAAALASDTPFIERLVWFWSNHFAVSIDKLPVVGLAGTLEFEAIRPNVFSHFGVMLSAVERHPAMLIYLDQAISVGPHSQLGEARARHGDRRVGFNENLAREILELHTLGVRSGYTQADVTEFARAMTGWTVGRIGGGPLARTLEGFGKPGQCVFAEPIHEPGTRTIMGKRYPDRGYHQAQGVLDDLAVAPATARHIATKLARHFAGDDPPAAMVVRLEQASYRRAAICPTSMSR